MKWLKALGVVACLLLVIGVVGFFTLGFYLSPQSKLQHADAIVAISGGDTVARTATAVDLYNQGYASWIIFSGAALDPNSPSNAAAMAQLAENQGIPASHILLDQTSVNTEANASDVSRIVKQYNFHSIILVTSPYHQRRASIVFTRALPGVIILNHSSIDLSWRRSDWWSTAYNRQLTLAEWEKTVYELIFK